MASKSEGMQRSAETHSNTVHSFQASTAWRRQLPVAESEAQHLLHSLLSLAWALRFRGVLSFEVEEDLRLGVESLAKFLATRSASARGAATTLSIPSEQKPQLVMECRGILVAMKPPGWEVDTAEQSDALSLSMFLRELSAEDRSQDKFNMIQHQKPLHCAPKEDR